MNTLVDGRANEGCQIYKSLVQHTGQQASAEILSAERGQRHSQHHAPIPCRRDLRPVCPAKVRREPNAHATEDTAKCLDTHVWGHNLYNRTDQRTDRTAIEPSFASECGTERSRRDTGDPGTEQQHGVEQRLMPRGDGPSVRGGIDLLAEILLKSLDGDNAGDRSLVKAEEDGAQGDDETVAIGGPVTAAPLQILRSS